ncbi:unnamed protein product [Lathyrus oleraceus]|uniref:Uncharacterized protein n=1 Tax=Pisum sativum TaxID=3888 RepID=A0A9D5A5R0_PEA|nr:uncharacterized protein LOC127096050 isoform X2 [Pisum sativum]KAI5395468.1 hypothetical protein KIW84_061875 [Pisum sativum]
MGTFCDETEISDHNQNHVIDASAKVDHKCSKKMEVDEGLNLNTVACLRGRLLAERHASKVAKEQAESMGKKLVELEKLVKEEIRLRDKSERKLKLLRKKLESSSSKSSKLSQLGHSDSSQKSENSCGLSSVSSNSKNSEANETRNCVKALTENLVANHSVSGSENGSSCTKECDSQITDNSSSSNYSEHGYSSLKNLSFEFENVKNDENNESKDLKNDEIRLSSLSTKSSVTENESDHADSFDNSLAIVPVTVNMTATSRAKNNHKQVNENVFEALDALRVAKEKLQSSLGTRQMIQVGLS